MVKVTGSKRNGIPRVSTREFADSGGEAAFRHERHLRATPFEKHDLLSEMEYIFLSCVSSFFFLFFFRKEGRRDDQNLSIRRGARRNTRNSRVIFFIFLRHFASYSFYHIRHTSTCFDRESSTFRVSAINIIAT